MLVTRLPCDWEGLHYRADVKHEEMFSLNITFLMFASVHLYHDDTHASGDKAKWKWGENGHVTSHARAEDVRKMWVHVLWHKRAYVQVFSFHCRVAKKEVDIRQLNVMAKRWKSNALSICVRGWMHPCSYRARGRCCQFTDDRVHDAFIAIACQGCLMGNKLTNMKWEIYCECHSI
jgi:hypothetical protein